MKGKIKKLLLNEEGQAAVEYAVLVGIFGFLGIALLNFALLTLGADFIFTWQSQFFSLKP